MRVPTSSAALFASLASVAPPTAPRAAVCLAERSSPLITSRARLLIAIGDAPPEPLTLGLYGEAAPASVALFEGLCAGTLASTLGNKDLTYAGSSVSRIERDKLITGGRSEPRALYTMIPSWPPRRHACSLPISPYISRQPLRREHALGRPRDRRDGLRAQRDGRPRERVHQRRREHAVA